MLTDDAVKHFGSKRALAAALNISQSAVSFWGDRVPPLRAATLAKLTDNALKFDPDEYAGYWQKNPKQEA